MWLTLRYTVSRGGASDPRTRFRSRYLIRSRRSSFVLIFTSGSCLPDLLLQDLTHVTHALLLVGIGLAQLMDVRRDLPDELAVGPGHRDVGLLVDRDVGPAGGVEHDRVRVPQREMDLFALHLGAVPDADDVELLLEAIGHAGHRVRHE